MKYDPESEALMCAQCGNREEIAVTDEQVVELDFREYMERGGSDEDKMTVHTVQCSSCGAVTTLEDNVESARCVYCTTPLVVEQAHDETVIRPKSMLPFGITEKEAMGKFKKWLTSYFWLPNKLKKATLNAKQFRGTYLPHWTYDSATTSRYTGQRGEHYYVTETYTENGQTKTRRVRKTRWYPASGVVHVNFDDVLVGASKSIPEKYMQALQPWDLDRMVDFDKKFLSGYVTEKYQVDLKEGWGKATNIMDGTIRSAVRRDIGGDEQRIHSVSTSHRNVTFKHILLPVYLSAYRYKEKLYNFYVNARTGEVQGKRPVSWIKVTIAVILGLAAIGAIIYFANGQQ